MFRIKNPLHLGEASSEQISEAYTNAKSYRAEVIEAATIVELELNEVLCDFIIGDDHTRRDRFKSHVLTTEAFGFFQKWKLIRAAIDSESEWKNLSEASKETSRIKELKSLISYRNAFAHGELVVDGASGSCILHYFEGDRKTQELSNDLLQSILDEATSVFLWLSNLNSSFDRKTNKF